MKAKLLVVTLLICGFQNCGEVQFAKDGGDASSQGVLICDPLTTAGGCGSTPTTTGLRGNIYYLPGASNVDDYIQMGRRLNVSVIMSKLDVPNRKWTSGFAGPGGTPLPDDNGEDLVEWFALDLRGKIQLPSGYAPGEYQFAFLSDDGAILDINGETVLNHDGEHAVEWKCASGPVTLQPGQKLDTRVRYFQGPRDYIALQLFFRPISESQRPCDDTGGFQIVPANAFSN